MKKHINDFANWLANKTSNTQPEFNPAEYRLLVKVAIKAGTHDISGDCIRRILNVDMMRANMYRNRMLADGFLY